LEQGTKCPTLNFSDGERAMIIKDSVGDWGIVVGRWEKFRKGIPGVRGRFHGSHIVLYLLVGKMYCVLFVSACFFSIVQKVLDTF